MGIEMAGGQDHLKGKIFRIGNMGAVGAPEILATLAATEYCTQETRLSNRRERPAGRLRGARMKVGIADTTFSRVNMGKIAIEELKKHASGEH